MDIEPKETGLLVIVWSLWVVTALLFGMAVRARFMEARRGLRRSVLRLSAALAIFTLSTLSIFISLTHHQAPAKAVQQTVPPETVEVFTPENKKKLEVLKEKVDKLDKERWELDSQIAQLRDQSKTAVGRPQNSPYSGPGLLERWSQISRRAMLQAIVGMLVLLTLGGFVAFLVAGNTDLLIPRWLLPGQKSKERKQAEEARKKLIEAVWEKNYARGLELAAELDPKKLEPLEFVDVQFLRAYCIVQLSQNPTASESESKEPSRLKEAVADLESVIEAAPKRAEAIYTLALTYGLIGDTAKALTLFERSREFLKSEELPLDENESVCLLRLAEAALSEAKSEEAEAYFHRVTRLNKLGGAVLQSRLRIGLIEVGKALDGAKFQEARASVATLAALPDLPQSERDAIQSIARAFDARLALRENESQKALVLATEFLNEFLPSGLPPVTDEIADELISPIQDADLTVLRETVSGFLFVRGIALCRIEAQQSTPLSEAQVAKIAEALLRCLQFHSRQRDVLGALGGLYYWFRRDKRAKALDWLEGALTLGVTSEIVSRIVEHDRATEAQRRKALEWFRSASGRFLRDPAVVQEIRTALVEELGRFQEFEPMLIELREKPQFESQEPTVQNIRDRSKYLADLAAEIAATHSVEKAARIAAIQGEYTASVGALEAALATLNTLDRRVFGELADSLTI